MIGAVFALSILAGLALDYLSETPERTDRDGRRLQRMLARWWTFSLFVLGAAFVCACLADGGRVGSWSSRSTSTSARSSRYQVSIASRGPRWAGTRAKFALLALVAPVLVLLWSSRSRLRTAAGWLLVGLVYADLFVTGLVLVPSGSADLLARRTTDISAQGERGPRAHLQDRAETAGQCTYGETDENVFRWAREGLVMSWPIADRVFAVNAEGNFKLPGVMNCRRTATTPTSRPNLQLRLLRMSNTDRVVVYSNAGPADDLSLLDYYATGTALEPESIEPVAEAMPRAYVVGGPWMPAAERSRFDAIANGDFNFREAALVERSGPWAKEFSDLKPGRVEQKVTRIEYGADMNSLAIDLWSGREALLVVTDAWYPGWRATVNGRAAPIAEVNAFQRGIRVPAGNSSVVMRYEPWTVHAGILVSLAALIAVVAWLVFNRSQPGPSAAAPQHPQSRPE